MALTLEQEWHIVQTIEKYIAWMVAQGYLVKLDNGKVKRTDKPMPDNIEEQYMRTKDS